MDNWTPINLHQISKNIATETGKSNLILTLSPLYAIEGSGEIYTELSAGAFAFRVADRLSQQDKKNTHTAGVSDFRQIILTKTPAAVIIGPELTRFEKIDLKSLVPQGWQKCDAGSESIHLFMLQPKK